LDPPPAGASPLRPELEALRRRYSDEALRALPRLLQLVDRNRYSPTYGSFDRAYWHYRTMDFPCGMAQEFALPLALAHHYPFPDNPYYQQERLRELALAAIGFARRSAHADGSCDDYFPYERALGAAVFSLYALSETCLVLGERPSEEIAFLARRARWLTHHNESGRLANHQALAALALHNAWLLTGDCAFERARDRYLEIVASWQSEEGWFQEYEGADPGYHTCTIDFLAKLMRKTEGTPLAERLRGLLRPAVGFAWHFMHPDGSYGGEYGSRNTYHFYPHGFELLAPFDARAGQIADQFLSLGLPRMTRSFNDDDRMCAHYIYDWLQAYLDFHPQRPEPINDRPNFNRYFPEARLLVRKTDRYYAVLSLAKGGVLKVFDATGPLFSDAGLIGRTGTGRVLVTHLIDDYHIRAERRREGGWIASAAGRMCERRVRLPTPARQIVFRAINLTLGRFASDLLRRWLQKLLITGKPRTDYTFSRQFAFTDDNIEILDEIGLPRGGAGSSANLVSLHAASDATSIYVANSNVYQRSVLLPWQDLGSALPELNARGRASVRRMALPRPGEEPESRRR